MKEEICYQKLVALYSKPLYNFCMHLTGNKDEAQDLFQDTFIKAIEKESVLWKIRKEQDFQFSEKNSYEEIPQEKNYLIGIAIKLWKYRKRKEGWRSQITPMDYQLENVELVSGHIATPEEEYIHKEEVFEIRRQVERLSDKLRIVIVLYYAQEMSTEEIARQLRIPAATVRSRLHKARNILKKEMEK